MPHGERAERDLQGEQAGGEREQARRHASRRRAAQRQRGQGREGERDASGDHPVAPLERDLQIEARHQLAEAERPVGAGEPGAVRPHQRAEHHQAPGQPEQRQEARGELPCRARVASGLPEHPPLLPVGEP